MSTECEENPLKKSGGTRVLVPGHQKSGALPSWPTGFCFNLKNRLQKYESILSANCLYVFYPKPGYIRTLPANNDQKTLPKNVGAPEFWCPGTRSLVPFQADQQVFVLISRRAS